MYSCRGKCKRSDLSLEEMKKEKTLHKYNRGICKSCHSDYNKKNLQINRAIKDPAFYLKCGSCTRMFKQFQSGPAKIFRDCCPFCESGDISKLTKKEIKSIKVQL